MHNDLKVSSMLSQMTGCPPFMAEYHSILFVSISISHFLYPLIFNGKFHVWTIVNNVDDAMNISVHIDF